MRGSYLLATALLAALVVFTAAEEAGKDVEIPTKCPAVDPMNTTVHLAHETDCTKFYMCFMGQRILRECPWMDQQHHHRLHFNPRLQVCDWPNHAGCISLTTDSGDSTVTQPGTKPTTTTPTPTTTTPTPTTTTPTPTTTTPTPTTTTPTPTTTTPTPTTTTPTPTTTTPTPTTTTPTPTTTTPTPTTTTPTPTTTTPTPTTTTPTPTTTTPTPTTTTPTPTTTTPTPTTTTPTPTTTTPTPTTTTPTPTTTTELPTTTGDPFESTNGTEAPPTCPGFGNGTIYLPHETDCRFYYACENGTVVLYQCSENLEFDPKTQSCDWPKGCVSTSTIIPIPSTPTPTTPTPTPKPPACPPGSNGTLPHECQCDRYYQCQNGDQVLKHCPPGLHWDRVNEVCDDPDIAGCPNYHPSTTSTHTTPTTHSTHTTPTTHTTHTTPSTPTTTVENPSECPPNGDIKIPHETNCSLYYECIDGQKIERECRPGFHFDPRLQVCDWPENVGCTDGPQTPSITPSSSTHLTTPTTVTTPSTTTSKKTPTHTTTRTTVTTPSTTTSKKTTTHTTTRTTVTTPSTVTVTHTTPVPSSKCPKLSEGEIVKIPHETNCSLYYVCQEHERRLEECPKGLHFDPRLQVCDFPDDSVCVDKPPVTATPTEPGTKPTTTRTTVTTPTTTTHKPTTTTTHKPTTTTTHKPTTTTTHKPTTTTTHKPTTTTTHKPTTTTTHRPTTTTRTTVTTPTTTHTTTRTTTRTTVTTSTTPVPSSECPILPNGEAVNIPHETTCSLYYRCEDGEKTLKSCPNGLHFNPRLQVCDFPENAGCTDKGSTDVTSSDGSTASPTEPTTVVIPTKCPPDNSGPVVHLPHETNCSLFYKCDMGEKVVMSCPKGLVYNRKLQLCDWPENVDCTNKPDHTSDDTHVTKTTVKHVTSSDGPTASPTEPTTVVIPTECPPDNSGPVVHLAHESNCSLFYKCDMGEKVEMACPKGLLFNVKLQLCDWPENVNCTNKPDHTSDDTHVTKTTVKHVTSSDGPTASPTEPTTVVIPTECPPDNSGPVVHLAHESNCSLFYKCDMGEKVEMACPKGLLFNVKLQLCDWPENVNCTNKPDHTSDDTHVTKTTVKHVTSSDGPTASPTEPTTVVIPTECPPDNSGPVVHLAHESNCSLFYKCDMGEKVEMACPKGLLFNVKLQLCDWPENVNCTNKPDYTSDDTHVTKTTLKHVTSSDGPTASPTEPTTVVIPTECPPDNSGPVVHLAHESNCSLFYTCDMGEKVEMACPKGLLFNVKLQLCDWPENVNCTNKPDHTSDDTHVTKTTLKHVTSSDGFTVSPTEPTTVVIPTECPPDNSGPVVHLAHESNCSLFYKCDMGEKVVMSCTKGLLFNPKIQLCDWPENVHCTNKPDHTSDDTHVTPTALQTSSSEKPTEPTTVEIPTECPPDNSGEVVQLPHETNCSLFYKCNMGHKIVMSCPKGLLFNVKLQVCDWPENVNCANKPDYTADDTHVTPTALQTSSSVKPTEPTTVEIPTECPPDNSGQVVQLPHETNCSLFYKCDEGKKVVKSCPDGLLFNPRVQVCDWPENVNCSDKPASTTVQPTPTTTTSVKPTTTRTTQTSVDTKPTTSKVTAATSGIDDVDEPQCPPSNDGEAIQLPHPTNCTLFYKCNGDKPVLQSCPPGLAFNKQLQVCDWPENANCADVPKDDFTGITQPTIQTPSTTRPTTQTPSTTGPTTQTPSSTHPTTRTPPTTDSFVSTSTVGQPTCVGTCPKTDPMDYTVLLPNEDCTKFCKCSNGRPYVYDCPAKLHFDPKLHVCNNPRVARCVGKGRVQQIDSDPRAEYY